MLSTSPVGTWKRRVWCAELDREVEVEFEQRRRSGFRWKTAVRSCTAFDPPEAVACRRRCTDPQYRRQWPPALPVHTRTLAA